MVLLRPAMVPPSLPVATVQPPVPAEVRSVQGQDMATLSLEAFVARQPETMASRPVEQPPAPAPSQQANQNLSLSVAITDGRALLHEPENFEVGTAGVIVRQPRDVNTSTAELDQAAVRYSNANFALESQHLRHLPREVRDSYARLTQVSMDAGDPMSRVALQLMLFEGRIQGSTADALVALAQLSEAPLSGLDAATLVADMVQEIQDPAAINQRNHGTCAATTVGIYLARQDPAEYVRVVSGLARDGKVRLNHGQGPEIRRGPGTEKDDGSIRSSAQRLLVPAFMDFANGERPTYDNATDRHVFADMPWYRSVSEGSGLRVADYARLMEAVTGDNIVPIRLNGSDPEARDVVWNRMVTAVKGGDGVIVAIPGDGGNHAVLLVEVTPTTATIINPWGHVEHVPTDWLHKYIAGTALPVDPAEQDGLPGISPNHRVERYAARDITVGPPSVNVTLPINPTTGKVLAGVGTGIGLSVGTGWVLLLHHRIHAGNRHRP